MKEKRDVFLQGHLFDTGVRDIIYIRDDIRGKIRAVFRF